MPCPEPKCGIRGGHTGRGDAAGPGLGGATMPRPEPQCGLGGGHTVRGDASGPGLGGSVMTVLGSGLELVENSTYYSLFWTRGNNLPRQIPKLYMPFTCTTWTWKTCPVGHRIKGWVIWIGRRRTDPCCD